MRGSQEIENKAFARVKVCLSKTYNTVKQTRENMLPPGCKLVAKLENFGESYLHDNTLEVGDFVPFFSNTQYSAVVDMQGLSFIALRSLFQHVFTSIRSVLKFIKNNTSLVIVGGMIHCRL